MVRRSTVDRSPHLPDHGLGYEAGAEYSRRDLIGPQRLTCRPTGAGGG
jgi:hypothetical protein